MEIKKIEKFKKSKLSNLSNNMYSFLKNNYGTSVNIGKQFSFDNYKDSVMSELVDFCSDFRELDESNKEELRQIAYDKRFLKEYVEEILENDYMLDYFTIYKIQQFINRVGKSMLEDDYKKFKRVSNYEKYIQYKDIEVDASSLIGFPSADRVISYLYKEFNIRRVSTNEYGEALLLRATDPVKDNPIYMDEINKLLFKAAVSVNERKQIVMEHPAKDNDTVFRYLCEGFVADKIPKKILKRVRKEDITEIEL